MMVAITITFASMETDGVMPTTQDKMKVLMKSTQRAEMDI